MGATARPLILVTNDDGIGSPGLDCLVEHLEPAGEVWVCAPAVEQSAVGHGLSLGRALRLRQHDERTFSVTGTPADAVLMALHQICQRPPDLVVSGINHGLNLGTDIFYSGTVAGAMEGAIRGLTGLAASQALPPASEAEEPLERLLARTARFVASVAQAVLQRPLPPGTILNLNAPANMTGRYVWTKLGSRKYRETVEERVDLQGKRYYWIGGPPLAGRSAPGTDTQAVEQGLMAVTHLGLDLTVRDSRALGSGALTAEGFEEG